MNVIEQVIHSRYSPGVDHGVEARVVARQGNKELWHLPGHKYWASRMHPSAYAVAKLQLVTLTEANQREIFPKQIKLWEGGDGKRFSKKLLLEYKQQIDDFFGCEVAAKLEPKKTLVIEGE